MKQDNYINKIAEADFHLIIKLYMNGLANIPAWYPLRGRPASDNYLCAHGEI